MKIVSDFDGVLTTQDAEAAAVADRLTEHVRAVLGDAIRADALLAGLRAEVRANPAEHGWFVGENLGCYADEDPYVFNNAVCRAIFESGPAELREKLRAQGFETADHLSTTCFNEGTEGWRAKNDAHVLDEALGAIQTFFASGCEVVIVSNSGTDRIRSILERTGLLRWGAGKLSLQGGARKFDVTNDRPTAVPESSEFGGRKILLRRGKYWDILQQEKPDVVIGDVLSLDCALPAALREAVEDFDELRVFLKRHPHTPRWALEGAAARGIEVVDSIARLPDLLRL